MVKVDEPAILADDAVHGRQSQPGASANRLRGEERFEQACSGRCIHAATVVADHQAGIRSRKKADVAGAVGLVERRNPGLDGDSPGVLDGIPGVHAQVGHLVAHHASVRPWNGLVDAPVPVSVTFVAELPDV